jgi:capsular polysaccharide biosynthesis protein
VAELQKRTETPSEYDEISLKELILSVWNERKIVALVVLVVMLATILYTFVVASPVYESSSVLIIKKPTEIETRYGTYQFPMENTNDYMQYIYSGDVLDKVVQQDHIEIGKTQLMNNIAIQQEKDSSRFKITVSGDTPEQAYEINNQLIQQYMKSIRIFMKKNALDTFILSLDSELAVLTRKIEYQDNLIKDTRALMMSIQPIYTLQKLLFSDPETAALYADRFNLDLSQISENVMTQEFVNENYFLLEAKALEYETVLIEIKQSLAEKKALYSELLDERTQYEQNAHTENDGLILNGKLDVMAKNVLISAYPEINESAVSPNKLLNLAIGAVLGIMLGVFIGLFKSYWKNS